MKQIDAYQTTDGQIFQFEKLAVQHQEKLDFEEFFVGSDWPLIECQMDWEELWNWLHLYRKEVLIFLGDTE